MYNEHESLTFHPLPITLEDIEGDVETIKALLRQADKAALEAHIDYVEKARYRDKLKAMWNRCYHD